ncbi:MAG TPA: hypothetical protein PLU72_05395 [Candidatus Ozemobacteraceae bacterium]|nr:hypothetical protein [Candidatus Ozemobacteraceae bacterium]HQG27607.1 hypothetical protein [Candidatus Ozemobacteraceae bacterium]
MKIQYWLWALWGAMFLSMLLKWKIDTYMVVALIILPILIVLMEMKDEISALQEESKHQRKFVMDRFAVLSDKQKDLANQFEKKVVVDFAEFAKSNPPPEKEQRPPAGNKKKKSGKRPEAGEEAGGEAQADQSVDLAEADERDAEKKEA